VNDYTARELGYTLSMEDSMLSYELSKYYYDRAR
jgi:hypothetical protein